MKTRSQKDDFDHAVFRKSVRRWRETIRRRKSLPSELTEGAEQIHPSVSVTSCDDMSRKNLIVRESVRRFRSLSNRRKADISDEHKMSNDSADIGDCSKNETEMFDNKSNSELEQSSEMNLPDLLKGNGNGVFFPVWM